MPDYISQAKVAVKKYYPQYEEYFKPIFEVINELDKSIINIINLKIHENLKIYSEDLKTDKDKQTTTLMVAEKINWKNEFTIASDIIVIDQNVWYDLREWVAGEIAWQIKKAISRELNVIKKKLDILNRINILKKNDHLSQKDNEELLNIIEDYYRVIEGTETLKDKRLTIRLTIIFREYLSRCKDIGRVPKKEIVEWVKNNP